MIARTIDGCPFDPAEPVWRVRTSTEHLLFQFAVPDASQALRDTLQVAVGRLLQQVRPELAYEALNRCRVLVRHAKKRTGRPIEAFDLPDFEGYRRGLSASQQYLAAVALDCLKRLVAVKFEGVTEDLRRELPLLHVAHLSKASPANLACPNQGPLTSGELALALRELTGAYEHGGVTLANFALALLMLVLAPRPGQAALLKVRDLALSSVQGGPRYTLAMPLIKILRAGKPPRRAQPRLLHENLGAVLARQCEEAIVWGAANGIAAPECPMFPAHLARRGDVSWPELPWTVGHATTSCLSNRAISTFRKLDLSSMRAEDKKHTVSATRLRRSLATIARGAGASYAQVGQMLWHQGETAAHIYVGPSVGLIERVEKAINFGPLAALYQRELAAYEATRSVGKR